MKHNKSFNEFYNYIKECDIEDLDVEAVAPNLMQIKFFIEYHSTYPEQHDITYLINFENENLIDVIKNDLIVAIDEDNEETKATFEDLEDLKEYFNQELS